MLNNAVRLCHEDAIDLRPETVERIKQTIRDWWVVAP